MLLSAIAAAPAGADNPDFGFIPAAETGENAAPPFVPGEVIVRFDPTAGAGERADARADAGTVSPEPLGLPGLQLVEIRDGDSVAQTVAQLEAEPAVRYAEPNYNYAVATMPNDPLVGDLWGLENVGQGVGGFTGALNDADIDAERAWEIEEGDPATVLAVMDTGVDIAHPDLEPQLWQNPGEAGGTLGVDDDNNGKVDDVLGWDFLNTAGNDSTPDAEDNDPSDLHGHGTHVAGTALARGDNSIGITGVAQRGSIMPLRVCSGYDGSCPIADQIEAVNYAAAEGASIVNGSIAGDGVSQSMRDTLNAHPDTLFVFAAGNDAENVDASPQGPCQSDQVGSGTYTANNVICVTATDQADRLGSFSNYGATGVDLAAPGTQILSTSARRIMFSDDFQTDDFATRWTKSAGSRWARVSEAPLTSFGVSDSPGGNYAAGTTSVLTSEAIALPAGYSSCRLNYYRSIVLGSGDSFDIEVLLNGFVRESVSFGGNENSARTTFISLNSGFDNGGEVRIRLRVKANNSGQADGVHMDDISLVCSGPPSDGAYEQRQGTSMATPHVSGTAALILSRDPDATPAQIKQIVFSTVNVIADLAGTSVTGGRLNAGRALAATPADTTITGGTVGEGETTSSRTASFTWTSTESAPTYRCSIDNGAWGPCGASTPVLANGAHTFRVRTVDPRGNIETSPATRTFTVDSPSFGMQITGGPAAGALINDRTPTFTFAAPDHPDASFTCRVDPGAQLGPGAFAPCSDGASHTPSPLSDGTWTIWVEARDGSNALIGEAGRTFHVDATAPETTLLSGPSGPRSTDSGDFTFSASETSATYQCRLDSAAWSSCTSPAPFSGLADGTHTFEVRALDGLGNADPTPASATFAIDTQAPEVTVSSAPAPLTNDATPGFAFAVEPGATVACSVDSGTATYTTCLSPQAHTVTAPLADGTWSFRVRATDSAGNVSVATRSFRVDATAPRTRIARKPAHVVHTRRARRTVVFAFAAGETARYRCAIDRAPMKACSRRITRRLRPGRHRIRVVATDLAGNRDATRAVYRFRVKRVR